MKVISVNIGERQTVRWKNQSYETGIFKYPVPGPVFLGELEVLHDQIVDRRFHGGIDKAVYVYGGNHYGFWKALYPDLEFTYGMFGENLTLDQLEEEKIFVGSIYSVGEALIQVTKPREPCVKLGIRFQDAGVIKQFWNTTKSGVYFKVLKTGSVEKDAAFLLVEQAKNTASVAEIYNSKKK